MKANVPLDSGYLPFLNGVMFVNLQEVIDHGMTYSTVELPIGEFEGPIYIRKPCTVVGNATTIWSKKGPALVIASNGVRVGNVRVEVIEADPNSADGVCLVSQYDDTEFRHIEILGQVKGVKGEEGAWKIPQVLSLGEFAAQEQTDYQMEIEIPAAAEIFSNIKGLTITPEKLTKGRNSVYLKLEPCREDTFIYGEIVIVGDFIRTIFLNGLAVQQTPHDGAVLLFTPESSTEQNALETKLLLSSSLHQPIVERHQEKQELLNDEKKEIPPKAVIAPLPADAYSLRRGERIAVEQFFPDTIGFTLTYTERYEPLEIDPYVILLNKDQKAQSDNDLIFFGNQRSLCGGIIYQEDSHKVIITPKAVNANIERIIVAYAIYGDDERKNFSMLQAIGLQLWDQTQEKVRFTIEDLHLERTIVAVEVYRYKGAWRINAVGSGYRDGLVRLCQSYGLEIAE